MRPPEEGTLAKHARFAREKLGLSRKAAAKAAGLDEATLARVENGGRVTDRAVRTLTNYFGLPANQGNNMKGLAVDQGTEKCAKASSFHVD